MIEMHYQTSRRIERPVFGLSIHRSDDAHITGPNTQFSDYDIPWIDGKGVIQYRVPSLPLLEGTYYVSAVACDWEGVEVFDCHDRLYPFRVLNTDGEQYGLITLKGEWLWKGLKADG